MLSEDDKNRIRLEEEGKAQARAEALEHAARTRASDEYHKQIRATLISRNKFAQMIGVSARTLEGWEQGRRQPTGAARIFLVIAAKHPQIVAEVVAETTGIAARPEVVAQKSAEHRVRKISAK
jgi:putative transcriptional regulator